MPGLDLFNKPNLEQRITSSSKDAAGALEHVAYKWDATTKQMTICAAAEVAVHGIAVQSADQDVDVSFDTAGILVGLANGTFDIGDALSTDTGGLFIKTAAQAATVAYAYSAGAQGKRCSLRLKA